MTWIIYWGLKAKLPTWTWAAQSSKSMSLPTFFRASCTSASRCHEYVNITGCFWQISMSYFFSRPRSHNTSYNIQSCASAKFTCRWFDLFPFLLLTRAPPVIYHVLSPSARWPSSSRCTLSSSEAHFLSCLTICLSALFRWVSSENELILSDPVWESISPPSLSQLVFHQNLLNCPGSAF